MDGWENIQAEKKRAMTKERIFSALGEHREAGENQAAVASGSDGTVAKKSAQAQLGQEGLCVGRYSHDGERRTLETTGSC